MVIYTSYYAGEIIGEAVSISLYPPKNWKGKHLPLFAPTDKLLRWWKSSDKDAEAEAEYRREFSEILSSRQNLIQLWVKKQKNNPIDMTLCCFEKTGDFCHRHQVGSEAIKVYLPELWGGELGAKKPVPISPITFSSQVLKLYEQCHASGYPVMCDRTSCGYYQVSLHGEDLGVWSDLGLLSLLSGLLDDFYRPRLVPSLAVPINLEPDSSGDLEDKRETSSSSLITRLGKLQGEELQQIQDWCNSIKHLMIPSVSQYADGRMELHLRRFVSLQSSKSGKKAEVKAIKPGFYPGVEAIEELGESLLPEFHQGLVLFYPAGTQIKVHRDSPAYASGAAQINVMGKAQFSISGCQDTRRMESYWLDEGDCITFDNKRPHGIERVMQPRWCICFFYLKSEYLELEKFEQLNLLK